MKLICQYLQEDIVDAQRIAVASIHPLQTASIKSAEPDAPLTNRFPGEGDAPFSQNILNVLMAEIESILEPDGVEDDIELELVSFVGVHGPILSISGILLASTSLLVLRSASCAV